jgi:hypothetical protein
VVDGDHRTHVYEASAGADHDNGHRHADGSEQ